MPWLDLLAYLFGGVIVGNAVPHLVSGMTGRAFQTPFAKPPGEGLSSATVNMLRGFANLVVGYGLVLHVGAFDLRDVQDAAALGLGILAIGLFGARHFGRFHGGDMAGPA